MNNCVLMAEIIQAPQLRFTQDNQTAIAEMRVQFPGSRPEDPPTQLKVVGWGNLAQEIQSSSYQEGDRVILEGRLGMNSIDRPEGFKEKVAELTLQRIYPLTGTVTAGSSQPLSSSTFASTPSASPVPQAAPRPSVPTPADQPELDDIPF
jgi:single-strand DNA-binding protein